MKDNFFKFKIEHLKEFEPRAKEDDLFSEFGEFLIDDSRTSLMTIYDKNGKLLFIAGLLHINNGVCEVYIFVSKHVESQKKYFNSQCRELLKIVKKMDYHRVQMVVREDFEKGLRWAEKMGFIKEGLLRHYFEDGANAYIFSMLEGVSG